MNTATDLVFGYHDHDLDGFMTGYLFDIFSINNIYGFDYSGANLLGEKLLKEEDLLGLSIKPKYFIFGDYCPSIDFLKRIVDDNENHRGEIKRVIIYDHHKASYNRVLKEIDNKYIETNQDTSTWDLEDGNTYIYYRYSNTDSGCKIVYEEISHPGSALLRLCGFQTQALLSEDSLIQYLVENISEYDTWQFTKDRQYETERIEFLKLIYYLQNYKTLKQFTDLIENKRKYPKSYGLDKIIDDMKYAGNELISSQISSNLRGIRNGTPITYGRFNFLLLSEGHPNYFMEEQIKELSNMVSYDGYVTYDINFPNSKVTLHFRGFSDSEVNIPSILDCYYGNGGGHEKAGSCTISLQEFINIIHNDRN